MKQAFLVLIISLLLYSCNYSNKEVLPNSNDFAEIYSSMDVSKQGWNEGNMQKYMDVYWKSDSLMFMGKKGITYGWQHTLNVFVTSYPNAEKRGKLDFEYIHIEALDIHTIHLLGKWKLTRTKDTLMGYYNLIWKNKNGKWKIIFDHSS